MSNPVSLLRTVYRLVGLVCIVWASPAAGHMNSDLSALKRLPGWQWAAPQTFHLASSRLESQFFQVAQDPVSAARQLIASNIPQLDRMVFGPAEIQLSGLWDGKHWLAQLRPTAQGGTAGVLSSLSATARHSSHFSVTEYLPAGCRPLLHVQTRDPGHRNQLFAHRCPGSSEVIRSHLSRALYAAGWRQYPIHAIEHSTGPGPTPSLVVDSADWQHPQRVERMTLMLRSTAAQAVDVVVWLRPEAP